MIISTDQKYYHFVILKEKIEDGIKNCQKYIDELNFPIEEDIKSKFQNFDVFNQVWYRSDINYSKAFNLDFSIRGDGKEPYLFSFLYSKISFNNVNFLILIFPYSVLAHDIIEKLKEENHLMRYVNFLYVNIPKTVELNFENKLGTKYLNQCKISSIDISLKNEVYLSSVKLTGKNPVMSDTYRKFFNAQQEETELNKNIGDDVLTNSEEKLFLENKRIVLACELFDKLGKGYGAKIHIDKHGNFKFYLHMFGVNLPVLSEFVLELIEFSCFDETAINPLSRDSIIDSEDETK